MTPSQQRTTGKFMARRIGGEAVTARCDFHRDGGGVDEPCPGQCDAPGCTLDGYYEVGINHICCAAHGAIVLLARAVSSALAADNAGA